MTLVTYSDTRCALGEGVFWHPERQSLFWFDILNATLYERGAGGEASWTFDRMCSAAGWIDDTRLLVASERDLFVLDLSSAAEHVLHPLEADNALTRSNDGRADPHGGFWIGTMGKEAEAGQGAIYRWHKGALRKLFDDITISNAICFSPDGRQAYFTDTATRVIRRIPLDDAGWPAAPSVPWLDLNAEGLNPDGAVTDGAGNIWNAQWGAGRVACYAPDGSFVTSIAVPAAQVTCPAFGGADGDTLFVTSAAHGTAGSDDAGRTFALTVGFGGRAEPRVIL